MKTSIATVSISGDLPRSSPPSPPPASTASRSSRTTSSPTTARPAEVGRMVRDAGLEITLFQPFRDFEGMPEPQRARAFDRAERKFDLMDELGADLILVCSNVSPVSLGGIDRAAADLRELGRARRRPRHPRRLRGAGLGPPRQRPPRRLGDRPPRRPSRRRPDPRQLPHARAQARPELDPLDPGRQDLHRPARRRAAHRHGPALLEPALPQHAGRGRPAGQGLPRRRRRHRLRRLARRSRSSTTSSAAARRARSPSTATARWSS